MQTPMSKQDAQCIGLVQETDSIRMEKKGKKFTMGFRIMLANKDTISIEGLSFLCTLSLSFHYVALYCSGTKATFDAFKK